VSRASPAGAPLLPGGRVAPRAAPQVSHHIHCNDDALDEDVFSAFPALRFDARLPRRWFHRYQHIYMARPPARPRRALAPAALGQGLHGAAPPAPWPPAHPQGPRPAAHRPGEGRGVRVAAVMCCPSCLQIVSLHAPCTTSKEWHTSVSDMQARAVLLRGRVKQAGCACAQGQSAHLKRPIACTRACMRAIFYLWRAQWATFPLLQLVFQIGDAAALLAGRTHGASLYGATAGDRAVAAAGKAAHAALLVQRGPGAAAAGVAAYMATQARR